MARLAGLGGLKGGWEEGCLNSAVVKMRKISYFVQRWEGVMAEGMR